MIAGVDACARCGVQGRSASTHIRTGGLSYRAGSGIPGRPCGHRRRWPQLDCHRRPHHQRHLPVGPRDRHGCRPDMAGDMGVCPPPGAGDYYPRPDAALRRRTLKKLEPAALGQGLRVRRDDFRESIPERRKDHSYRDATSGRSQTVCHSPTSTGEMSKRRL